jgi:hypothetical protein
MVEATIAPYSPIMSELVQAANSLPSEQLLNGQAADLVYTNLTLPASANGIGVTWTTSNSAITTAGVVTRPSYSDNDTAVTLTATFKKAGEATEYKRDYNFIVPSISVDDARIMEVKNSGFEDGDLDRWISVTLESDYSKSDERVYIGKNSLRMEDPELLIQSSKETAKIFGAREGYYYKAGAMLYTDGANTVPSLYIRFWDNEGMLLGSTAKNYATSNRGKWQNIEVGMTAPAGTAMATVLLYSGNSTSGVSYFDSIRLREYPIIRNGHIELGKTAWTAESGETNISVQPGPSGQALLLDGASAIHSAKQEATPGVVYYLTADHKVERGSADLELVFYKGDIKTGSRSITLAAGDWNRSTLISYAPADTTSIGAKLSTTDGKVFFDNVYVTRAPYGTAVSDGGFEKSSSYSPWTFLGGAIVSGENVLSGTSGLKVPSGGSAISGKMPVLEGKEYVAVVNAMGAGSIKLSFMSGSDAELASTGECSTSGGAWQKLTCSGIAPTGARYALITLNSSGVAYFDDADLMSLSSSVSNMSMENQNGNYAGTYPFNWKPFGEIASYSSGLSGQYTHEIKGLGIEAFGLGEGGVRSSMLNTVAAGKAYEASIKAKAEGGAYALRLEFWDERFTYISGDNQIISGDSWNTYHVAGNAPANAAYMSLSVISAAGNSGIVYLDEASIVPVVKEIGSQTQLFIDDYIIKSMGGATRTFHKAEKSTEQIIKKEHPWETDAIWIYGTVFYDEQEQIYKVWYQLRNSLVGYATSQDGVNWNKPLDLGVYRYKGSTANNIIGMQGMLDDAANGKFAIPSVFKDVYEPDPEKRYKMIAFNFNYKEGESFYCLYTSPDGLLWSTPTPIIAGGDVVTVARDEANDQYIGMFKLSVGGKRTQRMAVSKDLLNWSPLIRSYSVATPLDSLDSIRADSYGASFYPYDGVYVGFNWRFMITEGVMSGTIDAPLIFSRDLTEDWQRPFSESIIALGEPGSWDDSMLTTAMTPIRMGDELWLYYGGWNGDHGTSLRQAEIRIAKWRVDGFASLDSGASESVIETSPFIFDGNELRINANVRGKLEVELLDSAGNVIPGFGRKSGKPVTGDEISHTVEWKDKKLENLVGKEVVLKFYLTDGEVYSFGFVDNEQTVKVKSELTNLILQGQTYAETQYTAASWSKLQAALAEAIAVRDDMAATHKQVDKAAKKLQDAIAGLKLSR